jgi:hypothetical protein
MPEIRAFSSTRTRHRFLPILLALAAACARAPAPDQGDETLDTVTLDTAALDTATRDTPAVDTSTTPAVPGGDVPPDPTTAPHGPTAAPTPPHSLPRSFSVDSAAREWEGSVAYTHPDSMYLGYLETVRLLVSARLTPAQLEDTLRRLDPGHGTRSAGATLTEVMRAHLGGVGFEIAPQSPDTQVISGRRETTWTWQVRPLHEGRLELFLTLDAMYRVDGVERWASVRQLSDTIRVSVSADSTAAREAAKRRALRVGIGGWIADNIQWLWAAIILPLGGVVWGLLRRRR